MKEVTQVTVLWPAMAFISCGYQILVVVLFSACQTETKIAPVYLNCKQKSGEMLSGMKIGFNASTEKMILFMVKIFHHIHILMTVKFTATLGMLKKKYQ